jgi:hypothetical protein
VRVPGTLLFSLWVAAINNSLEEGDAGQILKLNKNYYPHLLLPPAPAGE